jgi:hypothetical protein
MEDFTVKGTEIVRPCARDVEKTAPAPVASKDLFRESANLPNNDRLQMNVGRFLLYIRYRENIRRIRASQSANTATANKKATVPAETTASDLLEELEKALRGTEASLSTNTPKPSDLAAIIQVLKELQTRILASAAQAETVLETFEGYVDEVDGDTAYVTLESKEHGDVLHGKYSASQLLKKGIEEQGRFLCRTIKVNGATRVDLQPLPDAEVTDDEVRAISEEIDRAFSSADSVIEY